MLPDLISRYYDINALNKAAALLSWDRQVLMPPAGAAARTEHTGRLARMTHELLISEETQRLIEEAGKQAEPGSDAAATVRVLRRELELNVKLPGALVEEKSRVSSEAYEVWREARATANFPMLAPYLEKLFDIARRTAELRGYRDHLYDPLIDSFEEGATTREASQMFDSLKAPLKELIDHAKEAWVDHPSLTAEWDQERLKRTAQNIAERIGFDFARGRLDITTNAFCSNFSCDDVRMTTRPSSHIGGILFSTLHEMGHGLYEQNSPKPWDRTPLAGGISLGVHESQSRTWENIVGRSRGLWTCFFPMLQQEFPELRSLSFDQFYRAINAVKPGPIRIGSDELTYNFHILIRFELETEIVAGHTKIADLPDAWNAKVEKYLGITPKNDSEGCLQDVHWSRGSVGYFPTYSMGNMIGWQIWRTLQRDVSNTEQLMSGGNFRPILEWLTDNVYSQGKRYTPKQLIERVTGRPMSTQDYIVGMRAKFSD